MKKTKKLEPEMTNILAKNVVALKCPQVALWEMSPAKNIHCVLY